MIPAWLFGEAQAGQRFLPQGIIRKHGYNENRSGVGRFGKGFAGKGENLRLQLRTAEFGVDVHANFAAAIRMQNGGKFTFLSLPGVGHLLDGRSKLAVGADVVAPIVEARDIPAVFESPIVQEDIAQEVAGAPEIVFVIT
ncbi:MAG: hypothetical protein BWY63_01554 [Chloroflexi bacterium ADurb.Bin360]|nr:MAG: hypothetical protein BWY63_01554 [Chloroflexi bacterium ADurb.Bin360]